MCAVACEFTGVGAVIFIAPDPSHDDGGEDPDGTETEWVIAGSSSPMIVRAGQRDREITSLMRIVGDAPGSFHPHAHFRVTSRAVRARSVFAEPPP